MTIAGAWIGVRTDGRRHLYMISDSRTRGSVLNDCSPKILTLPRSDCAICFAGDSIGTYPLMIHLANAIEAHQPARDRSVDIGVVKNHLLRVFTDTLATMNWVLEPRKSDLQFIFAGMSWRSKGFRLWTVEYNPVAKKFDAREASPNDGPIEKAAFVGDWAGRARAKLQRVSNTLTPQTSNAEFVVFEIVRDLIRDAQPHDSIGGVPQLIRIAEHMNTRIFAVRWPGPGGGVYLMGRKLFSYENTDNWILDAETLSIEKPRTYGHR